MNASQKQFSLSKSTNILGLPATFVIGFLILYFRSVVTITTVVTFPDIVDKMLLLAGSFFLLVSCSEKIYIYKGKQLLCLFLLFIGVYCYFRSGETAAFVVILLALSAAIVEDIDSVIRFWFVCTCFLLLFLVVLSLVTFLFDIESLKYSFRILDDGTYQQRYSLFFSHPNMFGAVVLMACSAFVYLNQEKLRFVHYFCILLIDLLTYIVCGSRTSVYLIVLLVALSCIMKKCSASQVSRLRIFVGILPIICFALVILLSGPLYNASLGELFTGRVSLWHSCLQNQGFTIFGQPFESTTSINDIGWTLYYNTLDCAYADCLFVIGIAFSVWYCWAIWRCATSPEYDAKKLIPTLVILIVYGMTEVHVFTFAISYILLMLGKPMFEKRKKNCMVKK